jgi:Sigma-70, region 4/Putative zinc-finger
VAVGDLEPAVDQSRFDDTGHWIAPPEHWTDLADDRLHAAKLAGGIRSAIEDLPERQRPVVTMRDINGMSSNEVCAVLDISEANQRVLLHRGRSKVRQALEGMLPRAARRRFEAHLADCPHCTEYLQQIRAAIARSLHPPAPRPSGRDEPPR